MDRVERDANSQLPTTVSYMAAFAMKNSPQLSKVLEQEHNVRKGKPAVDAMTQALEKLLLQKCTTQGKLRNSFGWKDVTMTDEEVKPVVKSAIKDWLTASN